MRSRPSEGALIVRQLRDGPAYYAKWRDSGGRQQMKAIGPAWIERHWEIWRKRRGACPEGHFTPDAAVERKRALIDEHESQLADKQADHRAGIPGRRSATFRDVAEAWHAEGKTVAGWKPATVRDRRSTLNAHLLPVFGERPIREISRDDVRRWWRDLHNARRPGGRMSERNANKLLAELRAIFNWAAEEYRLTERPADGIKKHRELTSEKPDFYSPEEIAALVRAAAGGQDALIYMVASYAGLRRAEIVSLRWLHIDFARSNIHVVESVSAGVDARVKDHEGRTVPLVPQLATALAAWRPDEARDDSLVFPGTLPDRKLDGDALGKRFRQARDRAGLRPLRFHDLRHTFGTLAVDGNASLVKVQAWMGHADIKTTMRYLHSRSRSEDAELLGAAFTADALTQLGTGLRGEDVSGQQIASLASADAGGTVRGVIDDELLREAGRRLAAAAPNARVILFGSHARGTAGERSDVDILVIEPEVENTALESVRLMRELRDLRVPFEVVVVSEREAEDWREVRGSLVHAAVAEGRLLAG